MHSLLTISLWQELQRFDRNFFLLLNKKLANPAFDAVLPFLREGNFWAPLYLFILLFVILNWGKQGAWWCVAFIVTVAIADLFGTHGLKETVQRLRPCNDPAIMEYVRLILKRCPGGYSFVSNHAANHFGLATFMILTLKPIFGRRMWFAYLWALLISFSQIYVGVHYPLDVAAGALLGMLAGYFTASVYQANFGKLASLT